MNRPDSEHEVPNLLTRARLGDAGARAALFARWQPRMLSRIRLMMGADARRRAESIDFVQGVFVKVLERLASAQFDDEAHVLRWMTAVARNDIRDHVGKQREQALESLSETWDPRLVRDPRTSSPVSHADREDRLVRLVEYLEQLPDHERTVVELHALEGLTFADIAACLGWSDDRARLAHLRGMARLGQWMGEPGK